jgi:hypothetical protein
MHHRAVGMRAVAALAAALVAATPSLAVTPGTELTRVEYTGTLYYEGHFRHPGDVHPYHSRQVYSTNGHGATRLDWTTWEDGDTALVPETYLLTADRVFHRDAPGEPWREIASRRKRDGQLQAVAGLPSELERVTRAEGDPHASWFVRAGRLERYIRLEPHPRLGDVRDSVSFEYAPHEPAPQSMAMALYMRDENWRLTSNRVSWSAEAQAESLFAVPASVEPASRDDEDDSLGTMPPLTPVAPGIWSADLTDIDSRTLIVEFHDYLAVIETAVGSANGERIVDMVHRKWPDKPIRYALFSHYHPHYAGGLRALIADGATVIATPGNEAFVRRVAEYPFQTWPDRLASHPRPVRVKTFTGRTELTDATNRLVAIDYGARSLHTDEFVLFWFPRQKLMFETEQGWSISNGKLRAGSRAKGLLGWCDEQGLDVQRFVQSWPMRDNAASLTRAEVDSLVRLSR